MNKIFLRYWRIVEYLLHFLFKEYPKGLNFSIRTKKKGITLIGNHGYALTSKKALKNILSNIPYKNRPFIDIGSGKGGVICFAYELGSSRTEGIEYEEFLHMIAQKNIEALGYSQFVKSTRIDARDFERYADFDIYFLFNPFDYDIYSKVINTIVQQNRFLKSPENTKYLICYGDANINAVFNTGCFDLLVEKECPYRGNTFRIFQMKSFS